MYYFPLRSDEYAYEMGYAYETGFLVDNFTGSGKCNTLQIKLAASVYTQVEQRSCTAADIFGLAVKRGWPKQSSST